MRTVRLLRMFIIVILGLANSAFGSDLPHSAEDVLYTVERTNSLVRSLKAEKSTQFFREKTFLKDADPALYYELRPDYKKTEILQAESPHDVKEILIEAPGKTIEIDPATGSVKEILPIEESPGDEGDKIAMDYDLHTRQFIANHDLFLRPDLAGENMYIIDAIAEFPVSWYHKVQLTVDYARGVVVSADYFDVKDKRLRKLVNSGFQEITPGFWYPFSRGETIREKAGGYIRKESTYSNLRIGIELSDNDFDPIYILRQRP